MVILRRIAILVVDQIEMNKLQEYEKLYTESISDSDSVMMRLIDSGAGKLPALVGTSDQLEKLIEYASLILKDEVKVVVHTIPKPNEGPDN